ncbi:lasso RiPP family leader peptide-containing protein [Arcticibacterium luteifluviistationis]|nr:lasso RiPP family leader peptide-containing protein [Arcticibacterium luteifluviistationis]
MLKKLSKKKYKKPVVTKLGTVKNLTLKTGSVSDFGSNQFQP